jgi:hypothetical protein
MISRRRKRACFTVMVVAGLALAVDRLVLTDVSMDPQSVLARQTDAGSEKTASLSAAEAPMLSIPELPFPRGLEPTYDASRLIRDLFALPEVVREGMANAGADKDGPNSAGQGRPEEANRATFVSLHRLDGVIIQARLRIAIVDGVWMRIGQSLDGCALKVIAGNEVRFSCSDGDAALTVNANDLLLRR